MIIFYDDLGSPHPLQTYSDYCIKHVKNGCDELSFCVDTQLPQYKMLYEECRVVTDGNDWLIKQIDDDRIGCQLNFDFLKSRIYRDYKSESKLLQEVLYAHLPAGWTIEGANVSSIRRTIQFDLCTDLDVVNQCMDTYNVYFVWKIKEKRLVVYSPDMMQSTGEYLTRELNLKSLTFKGETTEFATRLYAYGNEGMTLEEAIVDGKRYGLQYVENKSYCDKTICVYWSDDRYTDVDSMYADAKKKIAQLASPVRSYECNVVDLAKRSKKYSFLDFKLHKKVTLIDDERGLRVEHQIVEYVEYPDEPERNVITLSCVAEGIKDVISSGTAPSIDEMAKNLTTSFSQKILMATAMITGAFGGYVKSDGSEIFIMDNEDPAKAEVVWRWNINGFAKSSTGIDGPYTTSLTFDDHFITNTIDAMIIRGSYIEAGTITAEQISQSFKGEITDEINDATSEVTQNFNAENGKLVSKIEAEEKRATEAENGLSGDIEKAESRLSSKIEQTSSQITLSVSENYVAKEGLADAIAGSGALDGYATVASLTVLSNSIASEVTSLRQADSSLGNAMNSMGTHFSTQIKQTADSIAAEAKRATDEETAIRSLITQTADGITLSVSQNYVSKEGLEEEISSGGILDDYATKESLGEYATKSELEITNSAITSEVARAQEEETEIRSLISQTSDSILLSVSGSYVPKDGVADAVNGSGVLDDYVSTSELNIKANEIIGIARNGNSNGFYYSLNDYSFNVGRYMNFGTSSFQMPVLSVDANGATLQNCTILGTLTANFIHSGTLESTDRYGSTYYCSGMLNFNTRYYSGVQCPSYELSITNQTSYHTGTLALQSDYSGVTAVIINTDMFAVQANTIAFSASPIITSSVDGKNSISDIAEDYDAVFDGLNPVTYKYNDGTSGRLHTGFIVEDTINAIEKAGKTTVDFAAVCIWEEVSEDGLVERGGLRYEEIVALNTWQIQKLKRRIAELEALVIK